LLAIVTNSDYCGKPSICGFFIIDQPGYIPVGEVRLTGRAAFPVAT